MNSSSKAVRQAVKQYILDNITLEGYGIENTPQNLYNAFRSEKASYLNGRKPEHEIFADWLRGIPTAFNTAVYYDEMREVCINVFKTNTPAKRDDEKTAAFYYWMIYRELKAILAEPAKESERMLKKIQKSFK